MSFGKQIAVIVQSLNNLAVEGTKTWCASEFDSRGNLVKKNMFFFCRQLECQGQEEEHHWNWPSETPEGCLPQIQVRH